MGKYQNRAPGLGPARVGRSGPRRHLVAALQRPTEQGYMDEVRFMMRASCTASG